jgi:hypothetical protein
MKREIQISHRTIHTIILLVVVIALVGAGFLLQRRDPALLTPIVARFTGTQSALIQPPPQPLDALAAIAAVTAFYTLDYTEPVDQWQGRVCALTTPDGCQLIETLFSPPVHQVVETNQVKTGCTVQALRMVEDKGDTHTWLLEVTLNNPWPGEKSTTQVYAEVARTNGTWLLNRILFDQEAAARFGTLTPTP